MSVTGIANSILSTLSGSQNKQTPFQKIRSEFQQLGQDLQAGNLTQAQQDFTTLSQNLSGVSQNITAATPTNNVAQAFSQLGQDLQSGNLQSAQQDFTNLQQDVQQIAGQVGHHHHHHHTESSENSSGQQNNSIAQDFSQLAQSLQSGNLQSAQQAFSTLQNDLQQIGGLITSGSTSSTTTQAATPSLNVTV
jgi:outer membrane protein assembly factor BamD (BamD/ComL family)